MEKTQPLYEMTRGQLGSRTQKKETRLTPYHRMRSKWPKDFNGSRESTRLLEGNVGNLLSDIRSSRIFTDASTKTTETKEERNT